MLGLHRPSGERKNTSKDVLPSDRYDPATHGDHYRLGAIGRPELVHDMSHVHLDGGFADL